MKKRKILAVFMAVVFIPLIMTVSYLQWGNRNHYIVSVLIMAAAMAPFFAVFEKSRPDPRELVLIAVMSAAGVAGRAAFFMLLQFKPVGAIVIITGAALGCEAGFMTGALTMFISNMFFGQGPWTPWQMFAMGLIGFFAGIFFKKGVKSNARHILLCVYGALTTFFIYGPTVDTASFLIAGAEFSLKGLLTFYTAGAAFNIVHAISVSFFLLISAKPIFKKIDRVKRKYGLGE